MTWSDAARAAAAQARRVHGEKAGTPEQRGKIATKLRAIRNYLSAARGSNSDFAFRHHIASAGLRAQAAAKLRSKYGVPRKAGKY